MKHDRRCLLVCEGFTNSAQIFGRLLRDVFVDVEVIDVKGLCGRSLGDEHVIFLRVSHPQWRWVVDYLRERRLSFDYLIDDNFYEISSRVDPHNGPLYDHPATHAALTHYIANARTTIVFSHPFADEIRRRVPGANVRYVSPPVDLALFDRYCGARSQHNEGILRVGYATTPRAWLSPFITEIVRQTVARLGERVEFDLMGWWPSELASHSRVRTFDAISDYEAYVRFVADRGWDIGISPLGDSLFENCKTNNKFREYGAARIPAIYSDVPLYRSCVQHGVTGWLEPNDPLTWSSRIASLATNRDLIQRVADAAYHVVASEYPQPVSARALAQALNMTVGVK